MFIKNNRISNRQVKRMMFFDLFSTGILLIPFLNAFYAGRSGILTILLATAGAVIYGFILFWFYQKLEKNADGNVITGIFSIFYLVQFFFSSTFVLTLFTTVIQKAFLPYMNPFWILLTLILVSGYGALLGMEKKARLSECLYFLVLIPFILFLILGIRNIDAANLLPPEFGEKGFSGFLSGTFYVFLTFQAVGLLPFLLPYTTQKKKIKTEEGNIRTLLLKDKKILRYIIEAICLAGIVELLFYLVTVGTLGVGESRENLWSAVTILQMVELPGGLIRRQDGIMLAFWVISIFSIITSYLYHLSDLTNSWLAKTKIGSRKWLLAIYMVLLCFAARYALKMGVNSSMTWYGRYLAYAGIPQSLILPIILLCLQRLKKSVR